MIDLIFQGEAAWFGVPAVIGTIVFVIRLILMLTGSAADLDTHHSGDTHGHDDPSGVFKLLTFQSIMAFVMGFGWGGLAGLRGMGWPLFPSFMTGLVGGAAMMWLLAMLLRGIHELGSSGNIPLSAAVGLQGSVYIGVPARGGGVGQVRVVVMDRQRIFNAVSEGEAMATHARVRVVGVNEDNTLTVAAIEG